ncbi:fidgetin-like protein 1 [Sitophilus oryzae]|uniref:Fidgetin-like protein 1 n=1 Tax=Sitophilus oryzae TaxID=7048 RepID=A0A6J2Y1D7_SITOR|nr:fidgetin-like protein 1 [Sitophilus oryzae]
MTDYNITCFSLENNIFCELYDHKVRKYTDCVYQENENLYNNLMKKSYPNINIKRQFKITRELPKINLDTYLEDLKCSDSGKVYCSESEKISKQQLQQFGKLFSTNQDKQANIHILSSKIDKQVGKTSSSYTVKQEHIEKKRDVLNSFKSAREELDIQHSKVGFGGSTNVSDENLVGGQKRKLGMRRSVRDRFISPLLSRSNSNEEFDQKNEDVPVVHEKLKNIDPKMVELIMSEIMDQSPNISWNDIAGLEFAKTAIKEAVVWPMLRPDIFTGLRRPPKGILLFGPPGTGKTLIGKCVASQSKSTFFSISASSLTSKWIGDGEKMVRALFAVARVHQPSVVFIDEVDSLLTQRNETEHESSRRIKTEFLVQLDGASIDADERLLIIGATNRPQELDEAARRRFVKRLYIPLPDYTARHELLLKLFSNEKHLLIKEDFEKIAQLSEGYSGADIKNLCSEASLEPIRSIDFNDIQNIEASEVRALTMSDFEKSLNRVKPSVSPNDLLQYVKWDQTYGSGGS